MSVQVYDWILQRTLYSSLIQKFIPISLFLSVIFPCFKIVKLGVEIVKITLHKNMTLSPLIEIWNILFINLLSIPFSFFYTWLLFICTWTVHSYAQCHAALRTSTHVCKPFLADHSLAGPISSISKRRQLSHSPAPHFVCCW